MHIQTRLNSEGPFEIHKLAGIVPMAVVREQEALELDIRENEQQEPIILWKGKVVDGRCRMKALQKLGKHYLFKELDDTLEETDVAIFVKSVNTRRNLTTTQKIMVATQESLTPGSRSMPTIAASWAISRSILANAKYIVKMKPTFQEPLFNGQAVTIVDQKGNKVQTNKITAIYAYLKREEEDVQTDVEHAWSADTAINTQLGKEWFYSFIRENKVTNVAVQMELANRANNKFYKTKGTADEI